MIAHDRAYVVAMAPRRARWSTRADRADLTPEQRAYARARADTLSRGLRGRVGECGTRGVEVACGCGKKVAPWRCRKSLVCWSCAAHRRWQIVDRIEHAVRRQQAMVPASRTLLLTLTAAHEVRRLGGRKLNRAESLEDLRERLADGWRAFSRAAGKRWGYTPYVGVWEVTPGNRSRGHLHLHVVVQWGYRQWSEVAALWRECCPSSTRINIAEHFDDKRTAARRAAEYIAKYIGKTRGRPNSRPTAGHWSPELHAEVHAATYQLRWLFASRGHLPPLESLCPACGQNAQPCNHGLAWLASQGDAPVWEPLWDTPEWFDAEPWRQCRLL